MYFRVKHLIWHYYKWFPKFPLLLVIIILYYIILYYIILYYIILYYIILYYIILYATTAEVQYS